MWSENAEKRPKQTESLLSALSPLHPLVPLTSALEIKADAPLTTSEGSFRPNSDMR